MTPAEIGAEGADASLPSVFSDPRYVRAMASAAGLTVHEIPAAGTLTARRRGPVTEVVLPPLTPFSGVRVPVPLGESDVHKAQDALSQTAAELESRFSRLRIHLPPGVNDVRPLQWRGWRVSPLYTYVCDPADGMANASSGARRTLKKEAGGFDLVGDAALLPEIVQLVLAGYDRSGSEGPVGAGPLGRAAKALIDHGMAECVGIRNQEGLQAGIVLLHGAEASYYWMAGSRPGPAMTVLVAHALERLASRGVRRFDFVGANTPPIAEFKRRLGARLDTYWSATWENGLTRRLGGLKQAVRGR